MPPGAEPVSEQILVDLVSTLEGVTSGPAYFHTIRKVAKVTVGPWDISVYPYAEIAPGAAQVETHTGMYRIAQEYDVFLAVEEQTNPATKIEELVHDAVKAIMVDETRGGIAESTTILSWEPDYPTDEADVITWAVVRITVRYRTQISDLTVPT